MQHLAECHHQQRSTLVTMRYRSIILPFSLLTVAAGAAFFFAPHYSVYMVRKSVEARDANTLSRFVDYPALRKSLKANCTALLDKKSESAAGKEHGLKALGFALAQAFVNPVIDSLVTPDGIAMLLQGKKPELGRSRKHRESSASGDKAEESRTHLSMGYDGLNTFSVIVTRKDFASEPIRLIFQRYGITSWKLCAVQLES